MRGSPSSQKRTRQREYLANYYPSMSACRVCGNLPNDHLVHTRDVYTADELNSSPAYNGALPRAGAQDGLRVRLSGPDGSHIVWNIGDLVDSDGWGASRVAMVTSLLPHVRQFGTVEYTPEPDYHGSDHFTYEMGDGSRLTAQTAVEVLSPAAMETLERARRLHSTAGWCFRDPDAREQADARGDAGTGRADDLRGPLHGARPPLVVSRPSLGGSVPTR